MELILHTGAHFTEQERLIKSVLRNRQVLSERAVVVPGPNSYRGLMRDTLNAMGRADPADDAREVLLDVILDGSPADRVILSDANFFRTPATAFLRGALYPAAPRRMANMSRLFPQDRMEIFLGIRNPATLLPILRQHALDPSPAAFWDGRTPEDVRWSDTIAEIREAVPHVPVTVWCSEDLPLIWGQIIREICGFDPHEKVAGAFDLLASIMKKEGMERFRTYLAEHPEITEIQKRRVIAAFLDKFAIDDEIEEELDMPGWTEARVAQLSDLYDQDVELIARSPGVNLISP